MRKVKWNFARIERGTTVGLEGSEGVGYGYDVEVLLVEALPSAADVETVERKESDSREGAMLAGLPLGGRR
jgi:hypothetical protein